MRIRAVSGWSAAALVAVVVLWAPAPVAGQGQARPEDALERQKAIAEAARKASIRSGEEAAKAFEAEKTAKLAEALKRVYDPEAPAMANPPRTPWGAPDLRGYYVTATYTPLQRPNGVDKALYTREEAIQAFQRATEADLTVDPATVHYDWKEFGIDGWQSPIRPNRRTALIVDPANGRIPPLTPAAEKRRAEAAALRLKRDHQTGVEIFANLYTRCIQGGGGGALVDGGNPGSDGAAAGITTEIQIFQTPDHVTIYHQSNSDLRIIPLDGRPNLPETVRFWGGDARGRWEGNTLVVETGNFKDPAPATNFRGSTPALRLIERFSVVDKDTLRYQYTVIDPNTWTQPWSVEAPLPRIDPPLYEFACHEQNYGLINLVMGAQIRATAGELDPRDPRAGRLIAVPGR
jgi:hypothetical protein